MYPLSTIRRTYKIQGLQIESVFFHFNCVIKIYKESKFFNRFDLYVSTLCVYLKIKEFP